MLQNAPLLDELSYPSSPFSAHSVNIAEKINFSRVGDEDPHLYSSIYITNNISNTTNGNAGRSSSLTPRRLNKVKLSLTNKPNSCRLPGVTSRRDYVVSNYPTTPSTTTTINIGTPIWYTYEDQLESTRRRDEKNIRDLPHCQQTETPNSSLLSPLSGYKVETIQNSNSVSSESTPTHVKYGSMRKRRRCRAASSDRNFRFPVTSDLSRWFSKEEGVSVVPETAALNTEGGYFVGT